MRRIAIIAVTAVVCSFVSQGQSLDEAVQHNKRGLALYRESKLTEAEAEYRQGITIARSLGQPGLAEYTALMSNLAVALHMQGRIAEARTLLDECISIETTKLGNRGPTLAHALNDLALMELSEARMEQAVALLKRALSLKYVDDETRAGTLHNLAAAYFDMGQRRKAERMFETVIAEYDRLGIKKQSSPARTYLAKIIAAKGDTPRAEALLYQALELRKQEFGPEHPNVAFSLTDLGDFETTRGRYAEAIQYFEQALQLVEPVLGKDHVSSVATLFHYGDAKRKQGRYEEALALYERTGSILERHFGPEHARLAAVYQGAAICSSKLKRKQQAKEYEQRARTIESRAVDYGKHSVDVSSFLPPK